MDDTIKLLQNHLGQIDRQIADCKFVIKASMAAVEKENEGLASLESSRQQLLLAIERLQYAGATEGLA